jgi:hypothetical protein
MKIVTDEPRVWIHLGGLGALELSL